MTDSEILARLTDLMRVLTNEDTLVLTEASTPDDVDLWDSLLHLKLIVAIESEFDVKFDIDEINEPQNVEEIIRLISKKLG